MSFETWFDPKTNNDSPKSKIQTLFTEIDDYQKLENIIKLAYNEGVKDGIRRATWKTNER